jgi:hypothetical protein
MIGQLGGTIPYNLMFRAEPWVTEEIGALIAKSGCTDVFIGAEALDDEILTVLGKRVRRADILNSVAVLSRFVNVYMGLILFVPAVSGRALERQLLAIEEVLPYVSRIEPEILTIVNGSEFAAEPDKYGIVVNATARVINDSWCFGLSQDIPWTMADAELLENWVAHAGQLRTRCEGRVEDAYWHRVELLGSRCCLP